MAHLLLAVLVPLAGAGAVFAARGRRGRFAVLIATTLAHVGVTTSIWARRPAAGTTVEAVPGLLALDAAGLLFLSVVSVLYCLVAVQLVAYTRREPRGAPPTFLACHLFSLAAMSLATVAGHWGVFWVAMEATTLATAPLVFYHHGPRSLEATWKYLLVCSVGIALALLGTLFLGMAAEDVPGAENPLVFGTMLAKAGALAKPWLRIAAVFLVVGYGAKMGLAPMHTWKPDAYGEAPPPVAALLSGGLTNCAFLGIVRVTQLCAAAGEGPFARSILVALGLLTLGVGAASLVRQGNYRRLLAYSSVEHMGILVLALGVGGLAAFGAFLHAVNNSLTKGVLFLAAGNVLQERRTADVSGVRGLLRTAPFSAAFLVIGLLAAAGFPPFGTFVSEFTILRGMFAAGGTLVPLLYLVFLAVAFLGMAGPVLGMVHGDPAAPGAPDPAGAASPRESLVSLVPAAVLTAALLELGLCVPASLGELCEQASGFAGGGR